MDFFEEATLRFKQQLGVTQDKDAAEALGLSPRAWAGRKKRGSFPESEIYALAAKRPDLGLDVAYVLTGVPSAAHAALGQVKAASQLAQRLGGTAQEQARAAEVLYQQMHGQPLTGDEQMLIDAYRELEAAGRRKALAYVLGLSPVGGQSPSDAAPHNSAPGTDLIQTAASGTRVTQTFHNPVHGGVSGMGNVIHHAPVKRGGKK